MGLGGLNKTPDGVVIGLVQRHPRLRTSESKDTSNVLI